MTIVRLGQSGFDSRFRGEFISGETSSVLDVFDADGLTGAYSVKIDLGAGIFGFGFSPISQLRAGYWLKQRSISTTLTGQVPLFKIRQEGATTSAVIRWFYQQDKISLLVDDVVEESVCASVIGIKKYDYWMHLGIHAKSGADGFFSFYLNGLPIFNFIGDTGDDFVGVFCAGDDNTDGSWSDATVDDFYVDSTVGEDDGPAPAIRFYPSLPVGSGEDFDWEAIGESATYQCVLNAPLLETELAFADVAALVDTHLMTNVTLLGQQVHAVIPYVICRKTDPAIDSTITVHLFDGTLYESSAELPPGVGFSHLWDRQATQPDTTPWDETAANSVEMGYASSGDYA